MAAASGFALVVAAAALLGLMIASILVAIQWVMEGMFRRRLGVYCGYAELIAVLGLIAFILHKSEEKCGVGSRTCIDGGEWFAVFTFLFAGILGLIVMPVVFVSVLRLSKWSAHRATFGG